MDIFEKKDATYENAVIKVIGVGGGGCNAVAHMFSKDIEGVECIAANTDAKALKHIEVDTTLSLGSELTKGLGAGADPEIGRAAAIENRDNIAQVLTGTDMLFITAGMGGGTGTGAAPIIAEVAQELGILTVAVVTKPFHFEGQVRQKTASLGIEALSEQVDSHIVISNDRLLPVLGDTTLVEAFGEVNSVLYDAVCGIADLIIRPGLIGLDFADVRAVMHDMGTTMMGTGRVEVGSKAATKAAEEALSSPLLENVDLKNARGILVNVSGGKDLSLKDFTEVGNAVRNIASEDATIVIGVSINSNLHDTLKVTVIATGLNANKPVDKSKLDTILDIPSLGGISTQDVLDKNTLANTNQAAQVSSEVNDEQYSYLDVPTFIRSTQK
jgi:cell division protein FtsZ